MGLTPDHTGQYFAQHVACIHLAPGMCGRNQEGLAHDHMKVYELASYSDMVPEHIQREDTGPIYTPSHFATLSLERMILYPSLLLPLGMRHSQESSPSSILVALIESLADCNGYP